MPDFPYGKAAFVIMLIALVSAVLLFVAQQREKSEKFDLVLTTFAANHVPAYRAAIEQFEKDHNVKISVQVVNGRALNERLQASMAIGAEVPDLVEIMNGTMGTFTRGPLEDVQFRDLTDLIEEENLKEKIPISRFSLWSSRGRTFALPHDVHPVMLAYRRDLVEELGIDVERDLKTWDDFFKVGQRITKDLTGDGAIDRFMIDLPGPGDVLRLLITQRGGRLINEDGSIAFETEEVVDVFVWYTRASKGPNRIAFAAGWGQSLSTAVKEGTCLFYFCPDWRTFAFQTDIASMSGKMALMPLPAWTEGGIRTSTWGGTGLAFPKGGRNFELAYKLGKYLYYHPPDLGMRFKQMNILPPLKEAWTLPELAEPRPYFSGQAIGTMFAALGNDVPAEFVSPYNAPILARLGEAFGATSRAYENNPEMPVEQLREIARQQIKIAADRVRKEINHNSFQATDKAAGATTDTPVSVTSGSK